MAVGGFENRVGCQRPTAYLEQTMNGWHETEIRVRYAETDQMGIAHHSNYLIWFEAGRSDLCRARGFSYKEMEEQENALLVVAESYVRYKSPAFYEDILTVKTRIGEMRSRSLRFVYEIARAGDETLIAEGETLHVVTDQDQKVRTIPEVYRRLLADDGEIAFPANSAPH
jgi:acyl-CoA thioester hydrolase